MFSAVVSFELSTSKIKSLSHRFKYFSCLPTLTITSIFLMSNSPTDRHTVLVWRSGSALVSTNQVNLHRARLVLGWVTVSGFSSLCRTFILLCNQPPGQLSLAIPPWVGTMSTRQRAVTPCGWGVKAGMVCVWLLGKTV